MVGNNITSTINFNNRTAAILCTSEGWFLSGTLLEKPCINVINNNNNNNNNNSVPNIGGRAIHRGIW
jgi:hypothetical protein